MRFAGWYSLLVGFLMIGQWVFFLVAGQVPELETEPARIAMHLGAEILTAFLLIGAGFLLVRGRLSAGRLALVANGMLLYTVIQSPGYFVQRGEWIFVVMFAVLFVLTLFSILQLMRNIMKR